jgi:hypothetical protein
MSRKSSLDSVVQPMTGLERRQSPRTTMERHAYINIEPDNGGIVLNVSSGGLCFHSFDPVKRNGAIRFWFSDHDRRIDAEAELAWTDETQKGGLRFKALSADAQQQIRNWMNQPAIEIGAQGIPASSVPVARIVPSPFAGRTEAKAPHAFGPLAVVSPETKVVVPLRGFSGGLATGLLVAALVAAAFLFNNYRREFGETLIRMGERFAAKSQEQAQTISPASVTAPPAPQPASPTQQAPQSQTPVQQAPAQQAPVSQKASPPPQVISPAPQTVSAPPQVVAAAPKPSPALETVPVPRGEKPQPQPLASAEKLQPAAKLEPARLTSATPVATPPPANEPAPKVLAVAATPAISSAPLTTGSPSNRVPAASNLVAAKPATVPPIAPASRPGVQAEDSSTSSADATSEMYFEIGKFKDEEQAHESTEKLAQLGFPATAVQKGHLWRNSYHVLVGPYGDEDKAKVTHQDLLSQGFKPRPFERGSRSFSFRSGLNLSGPQPAPVGDYTISWESYVSDANVKFVHNDSVVATTDGRWVKRDVKYDHDAYVYRRNMDGTRTLLEIHFGGMKQALVFGKSQS